MDLISQIQSAPSGAIFGNESANPEGRTPASPYRYVLWRRWGAGRVFAHLCGLNPSTATHEIDDPTIRREIAFCKSWGMDGLIKTNAFAFRATQPVDMKRAVDPIGPENTWWIYEATQISAFNIACWGVHGEFMGRGEDLKSRYQWKCLGITKMGFPKHPLYLKKDTPLIDYP